MDNFFFAPSTMNSLGFWVLPLITGLGFKWIESILSKTRGHSNQQNDEDDLEQLLIETGYSYDPQQNIFYSRMDAWQRKYGYCQLYDEAMAPMSMIIDCEPIPFEYNNKRWLIELWKGQYGITTGCEVGVYVTDGLDLNIPNVFNGTFYHGVSDEERLPMSFALRKDDRLLFRRSDTHWWLTGFILGEFSEPVELVMDVAITLKDSGMRKAFVNKLIQMGYPDHEIEVDNNTVKLTFSKPHSKQPYSRNELISSLNQKKNKYLCEQYRLIAKEYHNIFETMKAIQKISPKLYRMMMNMGKPAKLFKEFESIMKYLDKKDL